MAILLKAYDYQNEFDFLPRLGNLQPDDLTLAKKTLEESFPSKYGELNILQRFLMLPKIPETQLSLNDALQKVGRFAGPGRQRFNEGAAAMYKTLEVLWPKLYPPQTPPPLSAQT